MIIRANTGFPRSWGLEWQNEMTEYSEVRWDWELGTLYLLPAQPLVFRELVPKGHSFAVNFADYVY